METITLSIHESSLEQFKNAMAETYVGEVQLIEQSPINKNECYTVTIAYTRSADLYYLGQNVGIAKAFHNMREAHDTNY